MTSTPVAFGVRLQSRHDVVKGTPSHSATLISPKFAGLLLPAHSKR